MTTFDVTAETDYLAKIIRSTPVAALAELIWNALDADATKVSVTFNEDKTAGVEEVVVSDNGDGLHLDDARPRFTKLGGSWKKNQRATAKGRFLHGSEGKGRFKALSLGRVAIWHVVFHDSVNLRRYQIEVHADSANRIEISEAVVAEKGAAPGVRVQISEVRKAKTTFVSANAVDELTEIFAPYLSDYKHVVVEIDGDRLDPAKHIKSRGSVQLTPIVIDDKERTATVDIIEWHEHDHRTLYLANEYGAPLHRCNRKFQVGGAKFSAYLRATYFSELLEVDVLDLAEMRPEVTQWINEAQDEIKKYFDERRLEEDVSLIQEWKKEEVYPYKGTPSGPIQEAEIKVFDIVATRVAKYVDEYRTGTKESQALNLRLLRSAIEKSPEDLQLILGEVLNLPVREQVRLADLLRDTSLTNVIHASVVVADRLKLIMGLQTLLYEPDYKKNLKERTQLHRIIAKNAWLFGEQWSISVDDRSLTQVLVAHKALLADTVHIDEDVKHVSKKRGIVDLMLSRVIRRYGTQAPAHLVVELKAPTVKIKSKECDQIIGYARSVKEDARFKKVDVKWDFWILSNEMDDDTRFRTEQKDGVLVDRDDMVVRVKLWSEVLDENRSRMQFYKELLEFEATEDGALRHLSERYSDLLEGVILQDDDANAA